MAAPLKPKNPSSDVPSAKKSPSTPAAPPAAQPRATRSHTKTPSVDAEQRATQALEIPAMPAPTPIDSGERNRSLLSESSAAGVNLEEAIRRRAYELYEERGRQDGRAEQDWLLAEAEIRDRGRRSVA